MHSAAKLAAGCLLTAVVGCAVTAEKGAPGSQDSDWPATTGDEFSRRYSPLAMIDRRNVATLEVAWRWRSPDADLMEDERFASGRMRPTAHEVSPVKIGDRLFVTTGFGLAAAIDAGTGETLWTYDPEAYSHGRPPNHGFTHRGAAYWGDPNTDGAGRVIYASVDAFLRAVDAGTGEPILSFGLGGSVDLTQGLRRPVERRTYTVSAPAVVCRDTIVIGTSISDGPTRPEHSPGDVRGFDVRTGQVLWTFHSVPQAGEFGQDTWENGSWEYSGSTNVWGLLSADEDLGLVYLPFSTPTNDWYGGHRLGDNLFAESLVAVDCRTGERRWHFQAVHHGLWDYDFPTSAILGDIEVEGRTVRAAMQLSKQAFVYVFDRESGEPVWPIEERAVPQSDVPGERTSATQPFPTKPPPFDRQGFSPDDVNDFTPEIRAEAERLLLPYRYGPLFTPPSEQGTIAFPGLEGGANWPGGAFDPETGMLYVPSFTQPSIMYVRRPDAARSSFNYVGGTRGVPRPFDLPASKPPYSRITAYDMNRGEIAWTVPLGEGPRRHPKLRDLGLPLLGSGVRGHVLVTKTLLIVTSGKSRSFRGREVEAEREWLESPERRDDELPWWDPRSSAREDWRYTVPKLRAYDKATGELLAELNLPAHTDASPITYVHEGVQYLVLALGGFGAPWEIVAYAPGN